MLGVGCYSAAKCIILGETTDSTGSNSYAVYATITNGKIGTPVALTSIEGAQYDAVSCTGSKCYAAGYYYDASANPTGFIEKV